MGLICIDELTEDDLERMHRLIHDRVTLNSSPGLVLGLTQFVGQKTPSAMLEDFRIDKAHANDFRRVAAIGERRWM
ncbi:SpoIIAA family protein [Nioella nitratireducens]|uniref:STAS/SEC14 domain-containing protein n=1 Tax=Nioella nitratireducens TaxID=1287720 RepID=UPI002D21A35A|nr:STAS/SEC14 domain-containing protein [Nioella nitratireducens]